MPDQLGQQFGQYRLLRLLGRGGVAEVYLAEHVHLKIHTAVKILYGQITTQNVQSFVTEAKTIAMLRHPHILRILDFGFEQTLPFLVMDYAVGGTLRDCHPHGSIVPLATVISYVKQVASALTYAHAQKLIHRDVKPENMLLDADGNVLLGDFGIVAVAHTTVSMKTMDNAGTIPYMAPEQINGKPCLASDQYALAIVMYEWLCGERPFVGDNPIEIAMKQISQDPPALRMHIPPLPLEVEQVVLKALKKAPGQRFPNILAFAQAFEDAAQLSGTTTLSVIPPHQVKQSLTSTQPASVNGKLSDKDKAILIKYDEDVANKVFTVSYKQDLYREKLNVLKRLNADGETILAYYDEGVANNAFTVSYKQDLYREKLNVLKQLSADGEAILAYYDEGIANDTFTVSYRQNLHREKLSTHSSEVKKVKTKSPLVKETEETATPRNDEKIGRQGGEQNTNDVSYQESSKKYIVQQEQQVEREQQHTQIGQAEQFLRGGQNRAAGAIAGVLFESALKKLCDRHGVSYPERAGLRLLIQNLRKADVITSEEASHMAHLASIRNKCAHANPVTTQEVSLLVGEVKKFVDRVNNEF